MVRLYVRDGLQMRSSKVNKLTSYLNYGARNLIRNKSQAFILALILASMNFIGILFSGYSAGIQNQLIKQTQVKFLGEAILSVGEKAPNLIWPDDILTFKWSEFKGSTLGEISAERQLRAKALIYSDNKQHIVLLAGIEEKQWQRLDWISSVSRGENGIALTLDSAQNLGVTTGDKVLVEIVTSLGRRNIEYFSVIGIYKMTGVPSLTVNHLAYMNITTLQSLSENSSTVISELIVRGNPEHIEAWFDTLGTVPESIKLWAWQSYGALFISMGRGFIYSVWILWAATMLLMSFFIIDVIRSTIRARKRELGIMTTTGLTKTQCFCLFGSEFFLVSLMSTAISSILGVALVYYFSKQGVAIPSLTFQSILGGYTHLYPQLHWLMTTVFISFQFGITLLVTLLALMELLKHPPQSVLRYE